MNEAERTVLQRHHKLLADDIMVTEDLLGVFFHKGIFERNMMDLITAERTHAGRVHKMLELLPRRGPNAFNGFIDIIKGEYPWLATSLQTDLKSVMAKELTKEIEPTDTPRTERAQNIPLQFENHQIEQDIKTKVGIFIHRHFGQSKRIWEKDKRALQTWLAESIQIERNRYMEWENRETSNKLCGTEDILFDELVNNQEIQEQLEICNAKLRVGLLNRINSHDSVDNTIDYLMESGTEETESTTSFCVTEKLINKLVEKVSSLEDQLNQCYNIIGPAGRKTTLASLLSNSMAEQRIKDREYGDMVKKNEKLLHDLYDYSKKCNKLDHECTENRALLDIQKKEIVKLSEENVELRTKNEDMQDTHLCSERQHLDKEKTLHDLRVLLKELQSSKNKLTEENETLRFKPANKPPQAMRPFGLQPLKHIPFQRNLSTSFTASHMSKKIVGKKPGIKRKKVQNNIENKHH